MRKCFGKNASEIVKSLMKKKGNYGSLLTKILNLDMAVAIAEEFDIILEKEEEKILCKRCSDKSEEDDERDLKERPPVV